VLGTRGGGTGRGRFGRESGSLRVTNRRPSEKTRKITKRFKRKPYRAQGGDQKGKWRRGQKKGVFKPLVKTPTSKKAQLSGELLRKGKKRECQTGGAKGDKKEEKRGGTKKRKAIIWKPTVKRKSRRVLSKSGGKTAAAG